MSNTIMTLNGNSVKLSVEEIFSGYDELKFITYSYSDKLIKYLSSFMRLEGIIGCPKNRSLQNKKEFVYYDNHVHIKVFLLKNNKTDHVRVITGSANLSYMGLDIHSQQAEEIDIVDNDKKLYNQYLDYYNQLRNEAMVAPTSDSELIKIFTDQYSDMDDFLYNIRPTAYVKYIYQSFAKLSEMHRYERVMLLRQVNKAYQQYEDAIKYLVQMAEQMNNEFDNIITIAKSFSKDHNVALNTVPNKDIDDDNTVLAYLKKDNVSFNDMQIAMLCSLFDQRLLRFNNIFKEYDKTFICLKLIKKYLEQFIQTK